jgi:HD domain-containing protein
MPETDELAGPVGERALATLRPLLVGPILGHSLRTYHLAAAEAAYQHWDVDPLDLVIACLFHDSGTIPDASPERFEVTGADRAVGFAREAGRDDASCRAIWDAVALHTSPGIAERHVPLTRALRSGVLADFGAPDLRARHRDLVVDLERRHPRAGIERVLAAAVVDAARALPDKAPASSWPADLVRGAAAATDGDNPNF